MLKRYAFFPGCVLNAAASEARTALEASAKLLDVELVEIPGWSCCGASHVQDIAPNEALAANARNLALGEQIGAPVITACSTCALMLRTAKAELDHGKKDQANHWLSAANLEYKGTVEVTTLLWELAKDLPALKAKVKKPLTGLNVACFYGCHSVRPEPIMSFESSRTPHSLEDIVTALGATPVPYARRLDCCGFHAVYPAEHDAMVMVSSLVTDAAKAKAHCVVSPCPLCQMQLDMYQGNAADVTGSNASVPALHLPQLLAIALGAAPDSLGLDRLIVAPDGLKKVLSL